MFQLNFLYVCKGDLVELMLICIALGNYVVIEITSQSRQVWYMLSKSP